MKEKVLAAIFDMNGTMVDDTKYNEEAWFTFCQKNKCDIKREEIRENVLGRINPDALRNLFGSDISDEDIKKYSDQKESLYRKIYSKHIKAVKGLEELLISLRKEGFKLAIATSACPENVEFILNALGLRKSFDSIIDDTQVNKGKPDPEIYLKAAKKLRVSPRDCIVFEDSLSGIKSAKGAGMRVVAITTSLSEKELSEADLIIKDFSYIGIKELKGLILR